MMERAKRGRELSAWGLNPERPDSGSVMDQDDDAHFKASTPHGVAGAALFPIMNAADALAMTCAMLELVPQSLPFNHHPASVMSLCRTAFESAAQSIWMLSPATRDQRRKRAAGASMVGAGQKSSHLRVELETHDAGKHVIPEPYLTAMRGHLQFAIEERDRVESLPRETDNFSTMVTKAGDWISANRPVHLKTELGAADIPIQISQQYRLCSSFTHGYNWGTDFCSNIGDVGAMLSDAMAVAIFVTESAVALYEAQATNPKYPRRAKSYPSRIQPTIAQYTALFA
ncbi:hypothetical protein [Nocardia gipuzkoensis]